MGGAVSAGLDHDDLIDKLIEADYIKTKQTEMVFRAVDRAFYFLPECKDGAYRDLAWKKGNIHLSAPCIYGEVMESLRLEPGLSFLNLGSGTGYLSTMAGLVLGPYGINHGIELHEDVINYANAKLMEFKETSPALDCYEFCEPHFVKGNSLCLGGSSRKYDRVYCGAACPENHESYMKNLLKIGGILVMPLNDQLMQITRLASDTWISQSVLSVSFATLQTPTSETSSPITLPEIKPLSLQELCRSTIRSILRKNAQQEYPKIAVRQRKKYTVKKKRHFHNLVIPIVDSSEDEGGHVNLGARREFGVFLSRISQRPRTSFVRFRNIEIREPSDDMTGIARREGPDEDDSPLRVPRSNPCDCTIGVHRMPAEEIGVVDDEDEADEDENEEEEDEIDDDERAAYEDDEDEGGEEEDDDDDDEEEDDDEEDRMSSRKRKVAKREKFDSGICTDMDNTQEGGRSSSDSDDDLKLQDNSDDTTMDVDYVDSNGPKTSKPKAHFEIEEVPVYSVIMREKISLLPLPPSLKDYLNYYRPFE